MAMVQTTINITHIAATPITIMSIVAILVCSNTFYFQEYLDNIIHLLLFTSIHFFHPRPPPKKPTVPSCAMAPWPAPPPAVPCHRWGAGGRAPSAAGRGGWRGSWGPGLLYNFSRGMLGLIIGLINFNNGWMMVDNGWSGVYHGWAYNVWLWWFDQEYEGF